jgi:hypothetical protein
MIALVRLYPQAWRDRYEVEFLDVLADRPPSLVSAAGGAAVVIAEGLPGHGWVTRSEPGTG